MTIFNLGSINADHFYSVPHLPAPGETLAAESFRIGLGGKGANQSIAVAQAGAKVVHIGAVGHDGDWAIARMREFGVGVDHIARLELPTSHAIINVDSHGENSIVIFGAANQALQKEDILSALADAKRGDICILQNETNLVSFTARAARALGMTVVYSAAPFDAASAAEVMPDIDLLVVNEVEASQLSASLNVSPDALPVQSLIVTKGSNGAVYRDDQQEFEAPAFKVTPVDTTGAGDTFLGYFVAGLDTGLSDREAMRLASAGAAIQVTRPGTADAIPTREEVNAFLEER